MTCGVAVAPVGWSGENGRVSVHRRFLIFVFSGWFFLLASRARAQLDISAAVSFIKQQNDASGPEKNYIVGCASPTPEAPPLSGQLYDNSLGVLVLLYDSAQGGSPSHQDSRARAEKILLYIAQHWQLPDGSFYDSYIGAAAGQLHRTSHSVAWYCVAALQFVRSGGNNNINNNAILFQSAAAALAWIRTLKLQPSGAFSWGYYGSGTDPCGGPSPLFNSYSTIGQAAVHAAAMLAFEMTADLEYYEMAKSAKSVLLTLFSGAPPQVSVGSLCGIVQNNNSMFAADAYFIPVLSLQNNFKITNSPGAPRWSAAFPTSVALSASTVTLGNSIFHGFNYSNLSASPAIHSEATAQAILAFSVTNFGTAVEILNYKSALAAAQTTAPGASVPPRGIVASVSETGAPIPTPYGFDYYAVQNVTSTAWSYFATIGVNPFYLLPANSTINIFGQDAPDFQLSPNSPLSPGADVTLQISGATPGAFAVLFISELYTPAGAAFVRPVAVIHPAVGGFLIDIPNIPTGGNFYDWPLGGVADDGSFQLTIPVDAALSGLSFSLQILTAGATTVLDASASRVVTIL